MIKRSLLAAAGLLCVVAPAAGQDIDSPYDFVETSQALRIFAGAVLTDRGVIDTGPASGYAAGIGYNIRISGPFNLDARAAFLPTERRVYDLTAADSADIAENPRVGLEQLGTADLSLLLVDASIRFDITGPRTWHRIQPYALLGIGGAFTVAEDNAVEEGLPTNVDLRVRFRNGVTGHVGLGAELYLSDQLTLRADARDLLWKVHTPDGFRVPGRVIDESEWVQTAHLSLGLAYRF